MAKTKAKSTVKYLDCLLYVRVDDHLRDQSGNQLLRNSELSHPQLIDSTRLALRHDVGLVSMSPSRYSITVARAFDDSVPVGPYIESSISDGADWLTTSNTSSKLRQLLASWSLQSLPPGAAIAASGFNEAFGVCFLFVLAFCLLCS
jgi:hypothetical protein